jgi:hypothetical protein
MKGEGSGSIPGPYAEGAAAPHSIPAS